MTPDWIGSLEGLRGAVGELLDDVYVGEWGKVLGGGDAAAAPAGPWTVVALQGGRLVGTALLRRGTALSAAERARFQVAHLAPVVPPERLAVGSRLAVTASLRASRLAIDLVQASVHEAARAGIELVFTAAQPHLLPLYARLGFEPFRDLVSDPGVGVVAPVVLSLCDRPGLERLGSPLAAEARDDPALRARLARRLRETPGWARRPRPARELDADDARRLLPGLEPGVAAGLLAQGSLLPCAPGDLLIARGQAVRTLYLVLEGQVSVWRGAGELAVVGPGGFVGELSYLLGVRQRHDVCAGAEGATLLAVPVRAFERAGDGLVAEAFLVQLAERIGERRRCL